jgi:hypothetical protein
MLVWSFPGYTEGSITDARLADMGGWPFLPDKAWINIQAFGFYSAHKQRLERRAAAAAATPPNLGRLLRRIFPVVHAQDYSDYDGCTGFAYLDYTWYRPCCDRHDRCFYKNDCSWKSWFFLPPNLGWHCEVVCNAPAVWCFLASTPGSPIWGWYP